MSNVPTVGATTSAVQGMLSKNKVTKTVGGGKPFLKFDAKRTGEWLFGVAGEGVTDEVFSLDLMSLQHGQILWHAKKCDRRLVPINEDMPEPQDPIHFTNAKGKPDTDEANEARSLEGSFEDGTGFILEMSTFGGRKAIDSVLAELFARAAAGSTFLFPQVKLGTNSYEHSQFGLVYEPVMECVAWFDESGAAEPAEGEKLDAPVAQNDATESAAPAVNAAPEAEVEEAAPPPRRRKRVPAAA
jgi:hypothetical protein